MANVTLENLSKSFTTKQGEVRAVDGINLSVKHGEMLVLLGPSGCGKTTTLRLIAGLEIPTAGTIHIGEREVSQMAPKDRDVAMVFQNYALYPHMTVYKNLAFGLKMRRTPKDEIKQKVAEVAKRLGLTALLERKPAALSGGECQRVALGRAIVRNPNVFLLDEPLSNLDAPLRLQTRSELKRLQRSLSATTIHVTHDQEEAMVLGDRIAVMNRGVVMQHGTPAEIYSQPKNVFVAGFVGTPKMNLIKGKLVGDSSASVFENEMGRCALPNQAHTMLSMLSSYLDQAIILGVRPENVQLQPLGSDSIDSVPINPSASLLSFCQATVTSSELTGDRANITFQHLSGTEMIARVSVDNIPPIGQKVQVSFESAKLHFFSPDQHGARIN